MEIWRPDLVQLLLQRRRSHLGVSFKVACVQVEVEAPRSLQTEKLFQSRIKKLGCYRYRSTPPACLKLIRVKAGTRGWGSNSRVSYCQLKAALLFHPLTICHRFQDKPTTQEHFYLHQGYQPFIMFNVKHPGRPQKTYASPSIPNARRNPAATSQENSLSASSIWFLILTRISVFHLSSRLIWSYP